MLTKSTIQGASRLTVFHGFLRVRHLGIRCNARQDCKIGISDCKEDEKFRSAYEGMILVSRSTWIGDRTAQHVTIIYLPTLRNTPRRAEHETGVKSRLNPAAATLLGVGWQQCSGPYRPPCSIACFFHLYPKLLTSIPACRKK